MKKVFYVLIILFAIMLVTAGIGTGIFLRDYEKTEVIKENINIVKEFSSQDIESLNFDFGYNNVNFKKSNDSNIYILVNGFYKSTYDNNNLSLIQLDSYDVNELDVYLRFDYSYNNLKLFYIEDYYSQEYDVTVYLPENKKFNVEVDGKNINVEDFNFNNFYVNSRSNVKLDNVSINVLEIKNNYRNIEINNLDVNEFYLDNSGSDKISINGLKANKLNLDISSNLMLIGDENSSIENFYIESNDNQIYLENLEISDFNAKMNYNVELKGKNLNFQDLTVKGDTIIDLNNLSFNKADFNVDYNNIKLDVSNLGNLKIKQLGEDTDLYLDKFESFTLNYKSYSGKLNNVFPIKIEKIDYNLISGKVGESSMNLINCENDNGNLNINYR